jgi:hypothetical protein
MFHCVLHVNLGLTLILQDGSNDAALSESAEIDARAMAMFLLYLLIFVLVFLLGTYAFLRASRRFRDSLARQKPERTDAGDVWAMHKLPEELEPPDENAASDDENGA